MKIFLTFCTLACTIYPVLLLVTLMGIGRIICNMLRIPMWLSYIWNGLAISVFFYAYLFIPLQRPGLGG